MFMMKFFFMMFFMSLMLINESSMVLMFYYNTMFLMSFMMISMFMFKDLSLWESVSMSFGLNYYSIYLIILSAWIIGLMFLSLDFFLKEVNRQVFVFLILLIVLVMFFLSMDLMLFYLMFEISMIPTFMLIIYWGSNPERLSATYYLMMYMLMISFPLLVLVFWIYSYSMTLKFMCLELVLEKYVLGWVNYLIIFFPFYIKMPMYLFHLWLPKAHVEAPVYGSMILAGVLLKMGSYGLVRLMKMMVKTSVMYSYQIFSVGVVGMLLVSMICLVQIDMKSLVAYSSVVHMNLMLCAFMTLFKLGVSGSYVMMVSHGLCSSGLFYMVNLYYSRTKSRLLILNKGLVSKLMGLMLWWFFLCMANMSFPFSLNFLGEIFMIMVILNWDKYIYLYMMLICFLSGAYSLYLYSYVQHGKGGYHESYFNFSFMKEFLVLIIHIYPLLLLLLNLMMFM
uniref:NADH-ubiquinone oxidoreductase chain 4 n=1 Tax=Crematogaster teranishii TaxID=2586727 RepID=A0A7L8Y477_9HYME|nr:NADH dehydrogenase subunit 4 [Crematogaster teranishii]QOI14035.1 NADH dehydrogenase subunit 4 [Crematogaster teranishii]